MVLLCSSKYIVATTNIDAMFHISEYVFGKYLLKYT